MNFISGIATYFKGGGPFMYVNLVVAIIVLAIAIDRFWVISRASRLNVKKFGDDLEARLSRGDTAGALALCRFHATQLAHFQADLALLAQRGQPHLFKAGLIGGIGNSGQILDFQRV